MNFLYETLKDPDIQIKFCWLSDRDYGQIEEKQECQLISINVYDSIVATVVHEILHYLYPKWGEVKVWRKEEQICRKLTKRQKKYILKLVYQKAVLNTAS
jgi:hypothetical protein